MAVDPVQLTASRLSSPQRLNLYTYAANNPILFFDPTGEDVAVGNRPITGWRPGHHAFIIITPTGANVQKYRNRIDPKSGSITLSGTPLGGMLVRVQNDPHDVGKATQIIDVAPPRGMSMERFESNVLAAFDSYANNLPYLYDPVPGGKYYNSNSFASGLLDAAGADKKPSAGADLEGYNAGWDNPVPLPSQVNHSGPGNGGKLAPGLTQYMDNADAQIGAVCAAEQKALSEGFRNGWKK